MFYKQLEIVNSTFVTVNLERREFGEELNLQNVFLEIKLKNLVES